MKIVVIVERTASDDFIETSNPERISIINSSNQAINLFDKSDFEKDIKPCLDVISYIGSYQERIILYIIFTKLN